MKAAALSTMSMLDESTCYSPLNNTSRTIRLLLLSPALHQDDRRLQCDLKPVCLDDRPVYNALSYAWGENDDLGLQIRVRGVLVGVRQNLWNALNCLRLKAKKSLWVDALCINQKDVHERNHQVSFMGTIYENASVVLVWLDIQGSLLTTLTIKMQIYVSSVISEIVLLFSVLIF